VKIGVIRGKKQNHMNSKFETLKANVQEIIDLIAAKNDREANNKLLEVSETLDEMIDFAEEDEEVREITRYQVLLNQLHVKINGEEPVDGE
jgi:CRISPR/Cas system CSM-associated protein Csm2 small subunit